MDEERPLGQRYVLERELGRGSMGVVHVARDTRSEREVAIKLVGEYPDRERLAAALRREAERMTRLNHPGIVPMLDFGLDGELLFVVMPLLEGQTLRELLSLGPLPIPLVAEIGHQVALALAHAHAHEVVHRDLKPENLMLISDAGELRVEIMDYGLARVIADENLRRRAAPVVGTLPYLAPEQLRGERSDPRSDLYALGIILYEAAVGRPPFVGDTHAVLEAITEATPVRPALLRTELPRDLDLLIVELLAKDGTRRPASGRDIAERLSPYADASQATNVLAQAWRGRAAQKIDAASGKSSTILGRNNALRSLDARLTAAIAGSLQLVLLSGELGMGKTTALDELALACQQRDVQLLRTGTSCGGEPLEPIGELLTAGLARRPEAAKDLEKEAADLVELFPSLDRDRLGELARRRAPDPGLFTALSEEGPRRRPRALDRARSRRRLSPRERIELLIVRTFEALVADERPLVLAIDDAHLHSREVTELIAQLFRRLARAPVLIVVAHQLSGLELNHPLRRLHTRTRLHPRCLAIDFGPLPEAVYDELLHRLLGGGALKPGLARRLHRQSGGIPAHAHELVLGALESGLLIRRGDVWHLDAAEWPIPRGLRERMADKLRALPKPLLSALRTGSVLAVSEGELDFEELLELHGRPRDELELVIDEALLRGMLEERRSEGRPRLRFTSELLRRVIHDDLPQAARRKLHEHCAKRAARILRGQSPEPGQARVQLAHLIEAGAAEAARPTVVALAQRALEEGRPMRALPSLMALLEIADGLPALERAELRLLSAELELQRDEPQAAVSALQRLAATLDESSDPRVLRLGERGAELAKTLDHRPLADRLLGLRPHDRRSAERRRRARVELATLRPATSSRSMAIGDLRLMHGEYTEARDAYEVARRRAAAEGQPEEEARQLQKLARVASKLGHYEVAIAYCRDGLGLLQHTRSLERVGLWAHAANAHCVAGHLDRATAELEAARAELATYPEHREPTRDRIEAEFERSRGNLLMARGRAEPAIEAYERCLSLTSTNDRWLASIARFNLGEACALAGQSSRALRELERAAADKRAIGDRWGLAHTHTARIRVLRDLGLLEDSIDMLQSARDLAEEVRDPRLFALVHTELGRHALLTGKLEQAVQEARRASDMAKAADAKPEAARARELLAAVYLARGEGEEAATQATIVTQQAEALGLGEVLIGALLTLAEASEPAQRPEHLARARATSETLGNPYRELDVAMTGLRLGLGDPNLAGDDYVALQQLASRAESLLAKRHLGLCQLAQAEVIAPYDLRGALDHARLAEGQLRRLGAKLDADRASELVARLTIEDRGR
ncbi:protein kinase [Pseudenhygromyxa sp. WMMC2535]|uniref:serine/threonine-protein kinase n=1 Tax=Pseudenhygromyxa sp. WMMC2535 TaxID=2712867 RepID=UPI0015578D86|nr:serine/threonine-protein kinase [Pseudenhygromyxa sp. WMMC2535]NVB38818.1 protein kinase [Pseudenhygromyxa sp. WMMC2535]